MNPITITNNGYPQSIDINGESMEIIPLGSGSEVGRSCIIIRFQNKSIMLDCGIHPAYSGLSSLPYFDEIDPATIDVLLITHFHLDHCGALPYFLEKTTFSGDCYMTHPTKAIYKLILADYVKVSHVSIEESLYEEKDLKKSLEKIKLIDYHQEINIKGIKFVAYNAGHVLGAAMFMVEIQGIRLLYTGDYSRELDRHLKPAEIPNFDFHVLIVESTYGIHQHENRNEREIDFTKYVDEIVSRGGKCLLPVFAIGRAQELLLIIDEYWEANPRLHGINIYYASSLASNSIEIFKTYINMSGDYVRKKFYDEGVNPFNFKHIKCVKTVDDLDDSKPAVVFASPGMLQSGLSRNLFEKWCTDSKNGIIVTGYCVDGTLAKFILGEPSDVKLSNDKLVHLKMTVKNVTFSAHSDFAHTNEFIQKLQPKNIILVHGEGKEMERLRNEYERLKHDNGIYKSFKPKIFNPKNCQRIVFNFKIQKDSYIVGSLTEKIIKSILIAPMQDQHYLSSDNKMEIDDMGDNQTTMNNTTANNNTKCLTETNNNDTNGNGNGNSNDEIMNNFIEISGVLLEEENLFLDQKDLKEYSNLQLNKFKQILRIKYTACREILLSIIKDYFNSVVQVDKNIYEVSCQIKVYFNNENVVLEWYANGYNDFLSNSLAMIITQIEQFPNNHIFKHYINSKDICQFKKEKLITFLRSKYCKVEENEEQKIIITNDDQQSCEVCYSTQAINCDDQKFGEKVMNDLEYFKEL